jgi:CO/xanthine dehydrogenase FAD-binding subunit
MDFLRASTWARALELKAERPDAVPICGGTDVMVEMNFRKHRPSALLDLSGIAELDGWTVEDGTVRIGAALSYTRIIDELAVLAPALAGAARTVGSPQIRNRGTLGGNLGSASPAGDGHPPLLATGAAVELASVRGTRTVDIHSFFTGPKRSVRAEDELIAAVRVPAARGPQQFSKIGTRNAMVIAVASFALALDRDARTAGTGIGSAGPTPLRAAEAEAFAAALDWDAPLTAADAKEFGALAARAAAPIDDVRGTAAYRRHTLAVLASRTLTWAWSDLCA